MKEKTSKQGPATICSYYLPTNPVKTWQNNVAKIWTIFGGILGFANNAAQFKYFSSNNKDFQRKKC